MLYPALILGATIFAAPRPQQQEPSPRAATLNAVATRARQLPHIDGRADDEVWRRATTYNEFRQFEPRVDVDPSFETEFQVAYDDRHLFVFVRMFDPHPDSIMHALTRRDVRGPSDQIKIIVDSYGDKRTGFEFAVNPDGVKRDFAISDDGNEDDSWNGIWDVGVQVDSLGWTAEFRIPLSQLRYNRAERHRFGFGVWRDIERYRERSSWPLWSPKRPGLTSQLGVLTGLDSITTARRLEVTPYAVTKNVQRAMSASQFRRDQQLSFGGDLKFGITPNVTLDATVNPDFGQVESDPAVLNLSAFETFLSERRPFFVEGTALYQFSLNCYIVVDCNTNEGLFYSRRIGRYPSLRDRYGDASTATATPIAGAGKLTGRTSSGLSFGLLDAFTERLEGTNFQTVEPRTNYAVVRAQQDLRGGETGLSLIATAVNRELDDLSSPFLHHSAYAGGASFRNRFYKKQYELAGQFAVSQVSGSPQVIAETQRSPVHYYQQPGDKLAVDPTRRTLSGHNEQIKFGKYGGGITRFETSVVRQSPGFEVNDIGYLNRADFLDWSTWGALTWREARGIYRWLQVNGNHWETWTTSGTRLQNAMNFNGHMGLKNNWDVHLGGTMDRLTESYCDRCTRGGPLLRGSKGFYPWGGVNTDSRRTVSGGMWFNFRYTDEGKTHGYSLSPYVNLRLSPSLEASVGTDFSRIHDNTQWFDNFTDALAVTHYAFGHLDRRTVSMSTRLNYAMTKDLTFEFYGQPFVAKGRYSDFREVSATPGADSYDDRFRSYTLPATSTKKTLFKQKALRSNAVMRWEYRPGSTLFVVWTHGRWDDTDPNTEQSWMRDYRDLFNLHPDNTFLVKVAYWMNR